MTVKAHELRLPMAETPTVWRERRVGHSRFRLWHWLPYYLRAVASWDGRSLGKNTDVTRVLPGADLATPLAWRLIGKQSLLIVRAASRTSGS